MTQDLALLNGEVTDARRGLASLAGYREQQSIDLYLEQLAGYVQQLNDVALAADDASIHAGWPSACKA